MIRSTLKTLDFALGSPLMIPGIVKVGIEVTYRCNSRCRSCRYWCADSQSKEEMTVVEYENMFREIVAMGGRRLGIVGGEPLLYSGIFEITRRGKNLGLAVTIGTNGLLLERYAKDIISSGVDILEVSIDGREEVHDKNRGVQGAFNQTLRGICEVLDNRKSRPLIQFNFTPNKINVGELLHVARIAREEGADILSVEPAHDLNEYLTIGSDLSINPQQIKKFREEVNILCQEFSDLLVPPMEYYEYIPDFFENPRNPHRLPKLSCCAGSLLIHIDPFGNVYSCPAKEKKIGNVRDKRLSVILRSEEMKNDIKRIKRGDHQQCWLNSTAPMNLVVGTLRQPHKWPGLARLMAGELSKRF